MIVVLPRLDRAAAVEIVDRCRERPLEEISRALPERSAAVTYSPVGGQRVTEGDLHALRSALLQIAREHGFPAPIERISAWEAASARALRQHLNITPHEASHDDAWSYVTCCWLLDLAIWRFTHEASLDRFIGHLNRNTFRRMWWRAEVLGPDIDLARLGEDELVNIMERTTLASDRRLARSIAAEFLYQLEGGGVDERMRLMREATKRILRLTPFIAFQALDDSLIRTVVADAFDAAAAGLAGERVVMPHRFGAAAPIASTEARILTRVDIREPSDDIPATLSDAAEMVNFDEVAHAALTIARRTGRVTNAALREVVPLITAEEARDVFKFLMERGELVRRGVKRGTHYVLPTEAEPVAATPAPQPESATAPPTPSPARLAPPVHPQRSPQSSDTALRRLLRRMR